MLLGRGQAKVGESVGGQSKAGAGSGPIPDFRGCRPVGHGPGPLPRDHRFTFPLAPAARMSWSVSPGSHFARRVTAPAGGENPPGMVTNAAALDAGSPPRRPGGFASPRLPRPQRSPLRPFARLHPTRQTIARHRLGLGLDTGSGSGSASGSRSIDAFGAADRATGTGPQPAEGLYAALPSLARFTLTSFDTPASCMVTPYRLSADSIVRLLWLITMNCERSVISRTISL